MPNKLATWAQAHKPQAALGAGAVGAVGIGLYRRRKANAAGSTTASGVPASATTAAQVVPGADGGDTAGGVPYSGGYAGDAMALYFAQSNSTLAGLATQLGLLDADVKKLAVAKPATPTKVTKPPAAPPPKKKPVKKPPPRPAPPPKPVKPPAKKTPPVKKPGPVKR